MRHTIPRNHDIGPVPASEPWGPLPGLDPVQEYRVLAHELQDIFPDTALRHLDRMIAREMALYGGYSVEVIAQAMLVASVHLADSMGENAPDYVSATMQAMLQQEGTDHPVLGWNV